MKWLYIMVGIVVGALVVYMVLGTERVAEAPVETPEPSEEEPNEEEPIEVPADIQAHIDEHADLIVLQSPQPYEKITSPLTIRGEARGYWFFEASFPVDIVNWDGLIIGSGIATAEGEWMTEDFVPFTATIQFENSYNSGDPAFMERGAIILQKDNPSGLPENDDALEIPILFAS